jgi:hypothetical protein
MSPRSIVPVVNSVASPRLRSRRKPARGRDGENRETALGYVRV